MKRPEIAAMLALGVTAAAVVAAAWKVSAPMCAGIPGFAGDPLVATEHAAQEAFYGAAGYRQSNEYPVVRAENWGSFWRVRETSSDPKTLEQAGGGQIEMDIDKCTGKVLRTVRSK